jgi:hypothetical protein
MADQIVVAAAEGDYEVFGALIREYWGWRRARYGDLAGFVEAVGGHQGLDAELKALPQTYGPAAGTVLLALREAQISGGIAYRDLHDGSWQMKRLLVPGRFQGRAPVGCCAKRFWTRRPPTGTRSWAWTPAIRTARRSRCTSGSASASA